MHSQEDRSEHSQEDRSEHSQEDRRGYAVHQDRIVQFAFFALVLPHGHTCAQECVEEYPDLTTTTTGQADRRKNVVASPFTYFLINHRNRTELWGQLVSRIGPEVLYPLLLLTGWVIAPRLNGPREGGKS